MVLERGVFEQLVGVLRGISPFHRWGAAGSDMLGVDGARASQVLDPSTPGKKAMHSPETPSLHCYVTKL